MSEESGSGTGGIIIFTLWYIMIFYNYYIKKEGCGKKEGCRSEDTGSIKLKLPLALGDVEGKIEVTPPVVEIKIPNKPQEPQAPEEPPKLEAAADTFSDAATLVSDQNVELEAEE